MRIAMVVSMGLFLGCSEEKNEEPVPLVTGNIAPDHPEWTLDADFSGYKAFAFDINDTFWSYISSNPDSNCGDVVNYLNVGGAPFDPVTVLSPGKCNMMVKLTGWESDWNGAFYAVDDPILVAATAIECAMGEGDFELLTPDFDDRDYYWTGTWWQGAPREYRFDIQGDRESGYSLDIEMSVYYGGFIHEEFNKYEAYGTVSGTIDAYVCEGLASTGL